MSTKFSDLLKPRLELSVAEQQRSSRSEFPRVVASSHINLWKPGDPMAAGGVRILVGVATYSKPNLELLDEINAVLTRRESATRVDVFDILDCSSIADLNKYVPGIGDVYQTPVIGVWIDGKLTRCASGHMARAEINKLLSLERSNGNK